MTETQLKKSRDTKEDTRPASAEGKAHKRPRLSDGEIRVTKKQKLKRPSSKVDFLSLPADILLLIPHHFYSICDLYALSTTCRTLYSFYSRLTHLKLPVSDNWKPSFLGSHPYLLLAGTASQIALWAQQSRHNRDELHESLLDGNAGLVALSNRVARLSLGDVRRLHASKCEVIDLLVPKLKSELTEPIRCLTAAVVERALYNYWIYCELFCTKGYSWEILQLLPEPQLCWPDDIADGDPRRFPKSSLDSAVRRRWMAYCMPDANNRWHKHPDSLYRDEATGREGSFQLEEHVEIWKCDSMTRSDEALWRFFANSDDNISLLTIDKDEEFEPRPYPQISLSYDHDNTLVVQITVARCLGLDRLKMALNISSDGDCSQMEKRLIDINRAVSRLDPGYREEWLCPFAMFASEKPGWVDWRGGLAQDVADALQTRSWTDEHLAERIRLEEESRTSYIRVEEMLDYLVEFERMVAPWLM